MPERTTTQIQPQGAGPKWSQHCGSPVTMSTAIGDKELWLDWWLAWMKLSVRAETTCRCMQLDVWAEHCHILIAVFIPSSPPLKLYVVAGLVAHMDETLH